MAPGLWAAAAFRMGETVLRRSFDDFARGLAINPLPGIDTPRNSASVSTPTTPRAIVLTTSPQSAVTPAALRDFLAAPGAPSGPIRLSSPVALLAEVKTGDLKSARELGLLTVLPMQASLADFDVTRALQFRAPLSKLVGLEALSNPYAIAQPMVIVHTQAAKGTNTTRLEVEALLSLRVAEKQVLHFGGVMRPSGTSVKLEGYLELWPSVLGLEGVTFDDVRFGLDTTPVGGAAVATIDARFEHQARQYDVHATATEAGINMFELKTGALTGEALQALYTLFNPILAASDAAAQHDRVQHGVRRSRAADIELLPYLDPHSGQLVPVRITFKPGEGVFGISAALRGSGKTCPFINGQQSTTGFTWRRACERPTD